MPPNPNNVEKQVALSDDWRDEEEFAEIYFFTNSACMISRTIEDPTAGVWLDGNEKRELYEALDEYYSDDRSWFAQLADRANMRLMSVTRKIKR